LEPKSTPFISELEDIYRTPKKDFINHLNQLDPKVINNLRDQLFHMFIDHFDDDTLSKNGFIIINNPQNHLKRRVKSAKAVYDIYHIGLSIFEDQICNNLASEICK